MAKLKTKKQEPKEVVEVEVKQTKQQRSLIRLVEKYIQDNLKIETGERIVVTELWERRYRVNVWQYNPNQVNHSFFIIIRDNEISYCNPAIKNSPATTP